MHNTKINIFLTLLFVLWTNNVSGQQRCSTPNNESGQCIPIKQCEKLITILTNSPKPLPMNIVNYVRNHNCGFDRTGPLVCCSNSNDDQTTSTITTNTNNGQNNGLINHKNINLLPFNSCGPIWTDKISNGNKTDLFEYPWMALLQYDTSTGLRFLCGGSLINERYVLTAAHCVTKLPSLTELVSVRLGEYDIESETDCQTIDDETVCAEPVQDIPVETVIFHPSYNSPKWSNDIAVIRLTRAANTKPESVRPICLPITNDLLSIEPKRVSISGWGTTERQQPSNALLQASVPVVTNDWCQQFYRRSVRLLPSQMCAGGETGVDSCKGDSGGPLVYPANLIGTKMIQFGIISLGVDSCTTTNNIPGIYTRVVYYIEWILDQMHS